MAIQIATILDGLHRSGVIHKDIKPTNILISYQIVVEKHGGQLTCVSTPGEGTTFAIQIPVALG